ncbi:MAG: alpha-amylase family glycosyl hydrolase, partial [Elusimicrobiota bacterium]
MKKLFCLLALIYFSAQLFAAKVEFVYKPKSGEKIEKIAVAGTFNSWNSGRDFLEKKADGTWHREMELENGVYYYKFVINGNNWVFDPRSDSSIKKDDGYGGYNSGVAVGESTGYNLGKPLPNDINLNALNFDDTKPEYFNAIDNELTGIGIRTLAGDVQEVNVSVNNSARIRLEKSKTTLGFDYYSKVIELPMPVKDGEKISLSFQLKDGSKKIAYPSDEKKIEVTFKKTFPVPGWAKGCIWYQIMLERFKNGSEENDPQGTLPWTWDFSKKAETEQGNFYSFVWGRFFGGDLQGLTEKLPYLKDLGITAIYLNPVFKSSSYQKYNTADYRHIDDHLGFILDPAEIKGETEDPATWKWTKTDKLFLEFLQKAHQMGFKVIIDGVFNHSGDDFWAFNDLKEKGQDSAYKNWYIVTDWNVFTKEAKNGRGYSGWAGFGGVPEFRKDQKTGLDAGVKKHILAITKRWMDPNGDSDPSDGIDGWRLDVPDCVPQTFWVDWCGLVKSINPDAYITGELWVEATDWLTPKLFHAQMNYPLAKLLIKFIADESLSPSKFDKALKELFATYPGQVNSVQMNLLDSHDTDRL